MRLVSPSKAIIMSDTSFPLVEVWLLDGHEDRDWSWFLQRFERLFAQKLRYALILDTSALTHTPSAQSRKHITDWQNANMHNTARWNVGTSVYISSGLIRGALTAMNWFAKQPVPMNYPASMAEGLDFCVSKLDENSIPVPSAVRQRQVSLLAKGPSERPLGTSESGIRPHVRSLQKTGG
jgi:hypothetical protein